MNCKTLGDLGTIITGKTPPTKEVSYWDGNIPFITPKDIQITKHVFSTERCISSEGLEKVRGAKLPAGAICVSCIGNIGYVGVTTETSVSNQQINSIVVNDDNDSEFVFYLLKNLWIYFKNYEGQSTTLSILNKTHFSEIEVNVPEKSVQKKIATILSCIDNKIELNQKINENLERQTQTLFRKWFVDNPDEVEWQSGTFSDLIEKTISGDWGKDAPSGKNTEMVYCIRGADIPDVRTGNKGKMPTRYILPKNYTAKHLINGDIVVEISGGSPTQSTGRAAAISSALLARYDKGMVCTNFCKALKPIAGHSMYIYHYWQHLYDMGVFFSYENGTTGIKNLDITGFLETEPITIAPLELIERFDLVCQSVYAKIYSNGLENERLANLRDTLLPKLMSGEIDVSNIDL